MPDNITIAIIVPICSRKRTYKNVLDTDFFRILVIVFQKHMINQVNITYNFYLGYDNDDFFFINNKEGMKTEFDKIFENKIGFNMIEMINLQGKVGQNLVKISRCCFKRM